MVGGCGREKQGRKPAHAERQLIGRLLQPLGFLFLFVHVMFVLFVFELTAYQPSGHDLSQFVCTRICDCVSVYVCIGLFLLRRVAVPRLPVFCVVFRSKSVVFP